MSEEIAGKNEVKWRDRKHWMWFPWSFTKYEVRNGRLYVERGLFKTEFDEVLLYRIMDISLSRTLAQKIFGTGTVTLYTKVDVNKQIQLQNIKNPVEVKEYLSDLIEGVRNDKKVVGKEFNSMVCDVHGEDGMDDMSDSDGDFDLGE